MADKPKDSKDGLGASIAEGFDDSDEGQDDARKAGDDTGAKDGNDEGADGGSDDSKRGKPEGKKDKKDGEGEGDDAKVTMTKAELKELVKEANTEAVSSAVAAVNSTKDKQIQAERKKSAEERESSLRGQEEAKLAGLTGDDRARMQTVVDTDRTKREANQEKADATEMYRVAKVTQNFTQYGKFGVTEDQLQKCESEAEMLALCTTAERDYWEGVATGKIRPDGDTQTQKRQKAKDKPEGSQRPTNIGAGGGGGSDNNDKGQATTLDGFGKGLVEGGVVPGGGIQRKN